MTTALIPGSTYRLMSDLKIGDCQFVNGEVVVFSSGGYSRYDDCYIYHFVDKAGEKRMCLSENSLTNAELDLFELTS